MLPRHRRADGRERSRTLRFTAGCPNDGGGSCGWPTLRARMVEPVLGHPSRDEPARADRAGRGPGYGPHRAIVFRSGHHSAAYQPSARRRQASQPCLAAVCIRSPMRTPENGPVVILPSRSMASRRAPLATRRGGIGARRSGPASPIRANRCDTGGAFASSPMAWRTRASGPTWRYMRAAKSSRSAGGWAAAKRKPRPCSPRGASHRGVGPGQRGGARRVSSRCSPGCNRGLRHAGPARGQGAARCRLISASVSCVLMPGSTRAAGVRVAGRRPASRANRLIMRGFSRPLASRLLPGAW